MKQVADIQEAPAVSLPRKIAHWPIDRLKPYERNPRTHSPEQVTKIAASLLEFGWTNPILVDADAGIIAGHGRLLAARELGMKTVPVIELPHLTEAQRRAYVIADNRLALDAGWDEDLLAEELKALEGLDFNLELTGFDLDELHALLVDPEAIEVAARAIQYSSKPGENVLDLFGGSGSTLIGAEETGRRAFLMELDTAYTDVIVLRWQEATGQKAVLDGDGRSFEAITAERQGRPGE